MLPQKNLTTICFAHAAYRLRERYLARNMGINSFEVRESCDLERRIGEANVLVVSGLWSDALLEHAGKLHFIQSIGAGTDQFDRDALRQKGVRLASARGVNANAVSEHAMALILALTRRLPEARDNQAKKHWRGMIGDLTQREDELGGKTLVVVGLGAIGGRLARLARAFGLHVIGVKRDPTSGGESADAVHAIVDLKLLLPQADFLVLTCPLTKETENLINAEAFAAMKRTAYLINVARGGCVDEKAIIDALEGKMIAGAALDVTAKEPLPASSPLWEMENVLITPHTGGETRRYEDNVLDIMTENLERLWRGESTLRNQIV